MNQMDWKRLQFHEIFLAEEENAFTHRGSHPV